MDHLRRGVAASDLEIDDALVAALAVEIDGMTPIILANVGYIYRISPSYATHLLDLIIATATADSLPLSNLTLNDVERSLNSSDERPECIETILRSFAEIPVERTRPFCQADPAFSLSHIKIAQWYGIRTLSSLNGSFAIDTFLHKWESSLPTAIDKVRPGLELLTGNYYHPSPTTIQYLPASELSAIPEQRFAQLFGIKDKWELGEMMPFLEGCVQGGEGWEKRAERECQKWARVKGKLVMKR